MADDEPREEQPSTLSEDDWLASRLSEIHAKVKAAGAGRMPDPPAWNYQRKKGPATPSSPMIGVAFGLSLLYTLLGPILAGYVIGLIIDRYAHRTGSAPIGALIGMVAGFIAMLVLAYSRMAQEDRKK